MQDGGVRLGFTSTGNNSHNIIFSQKVFNRHLKACFARGSKLISYRKFSSDLKAEFALQVTQWMHPCYTENRRGDNPDRVHFLRWHSVIPAVGRVRNKFTTARTYLSADALFS